MLLGSAGVRIGTLPNLITSPFCPYAAEKVLDPKHPKPWHCYNAHPIWWGHHPRSVPELLMDGVGEKGAIPTPSTTIHCQIPVPTLVSNGILGVLILKDWEVDLHMAPRGDVSHSMDALILPTSQTLTTLMIKLMLCSCHSQIHDLMKVKAICVEPPIATHCSHCLWPQLWPHCSTQPNSCWPALGPSWGTSHCSAVAGRLADHGDKS